VAQVDDLRVWVAHWAGCSGGTIGWRFEQAGKVAGVAQWAAPQRLIPSGGCIMKKAALLLALMLARREFAAY
jgi:hypothetical protein